MSWDIHRIAFRITCWLYLSYFVHVVVGLPSLGIPEFLENYIHFDP